PASRPTPTAGRPPRRPGPTRARCPLPECASPLTAAHRRASAAAAPPSPPSPATRTTSRLPTVARADRAPKAFLPPQPCATRSRRAERGTVLVIAKPRQDVTRSGCSSKAPGTSAASIAYRSAISSPLIDAPNVPLTHAPTINEGRYL